MSSCSLGFWLVGAPCGDRRLINWAAGFSAYASCDVRAELRKESYLSVFSFDSALYERQYRTDCLNVRGYDGVCDSQHLWFDIDRKGDLERALAESRRLVDFLIRRYSLPEESLLVFFSGYKGFHVGLPTSLWAPEPAIDFNDCAKRLACFLAESAGVEIDSGVYDKVRLFRAPNSRHPKSGLYKRNLSRRELIQFEMPEILDSARAPQPFEVPPALEAVEQAVVDWREACAKARTATAGLTRQRARGEPVRLYAATMEFIREGAPQGQRANRLFAAAANLAECGCPTLLVEQLLQGSALDCGLPPREIRSNIKNGVERGRHAS